MDVHASLQEELIRRKKRESAPPFDLSTEADRTFLAKCVLHSADISNPTRPFKVCAHISMLAIQEFQQQAAEEKALGLPYSESMLAADHASKCKGELGFTRFLAKPWFTAMLDCFPDASRQALDTIQANEAQWELQAKLPSLTLV